MSVESIVKPAETIAYTHALAEVVKALTCFVVWAGPQTGMRRDGIYTEDSDAMPAVLTSRDDALVASYGAIERIASKF